MSLHIDYQCDNCDFTFLGGYGVGGYNVGSGTIITFFEFRSICKNCLSSFPIYSEDLGYLKSEKSCFLLSEGLKSKPEKLCKSEQRFLKRRIKHANKTQKQQIQLEQVELTITKARNVMISEVKSGLPLEVIEDKDLIRLKTSELCCPSCNIVGKIVLGFGVSEICPKCNRGNLLRCG